MEITFQAFVAKQDSSLPFKSVKAVLDLHAEGATVPFIARYRKEKTGNLNEIQIRSSIEYFETYNEIIKRKAFLLKEIGEQGNLTEEIKKRIELSFDLGELEEIYRPFKKKKKTKATIARDAGLEPLANWLWDLGHGLIQDQIEMEVKAKSFVNLEKNVATYDIALKGAQDILVEKIANDVGLRKKVFTEFFDRGFVLAKRTKNFKVNSKFSMYEDFKETVKSLMDAKSSHRYLAMRRGWQEEELTVSIDGNMDLLLKEFESFATTLKDNKLADYLKECAKLALNVYVQPSVTNEVHKLLKDKSDEDACRVFAENVRKVLLSSPYGAKVVIGIDPGLRTGCKIALIDKGGNFITHTVMQTLGDGAHESAKKLFSEVLSKMKIEAIAVGNGTAGRETEAFMRKVLKDISQESIPVVMVSEAGASVYSASEVAAQEFPDLDVTVRGAISIARRLQDPLSELVKIDPKSIGVGQYQHDVNQSLLKKSLESVVESCVNLVGVDLNTASTSLLSYIAGVGPAMAKSIVETRKKKLFQERSELMEVPKFSAKAYEQAAGFLRIPNGKVSLDTTGIHPERYAAVREMATELGVTVTELIGSGASKLLPLKDKWSKILGVYTFDDIVKELEKPGRDPRDPFKIFQFRADIFEIKDLTEGMICPGIVTNVTNFGAFVDIGVHQDGLVHISELSHQFIDDPRKVVNPGDHVTVKVLTADKEKKQIALTMKLTEAPKVEHRPRPQKQNDRHFDKGRPQQPRQTQNASNQNKNNYRDHDKKHVAGKGKPDQRPPDRRGSPFNNPFASLGNIKK